MKVSEKHIIRLIKKCINKNQSAQRKLYDLLYDSVLKSIKGFGFSKEEIEDVAQESFIRIFLNLKSFDHEQGTIFTWSSVISKRQAINHYRKKSKYIKRFAEIIDYSFLASSQKEIDFLAMEIVFDTVETLPEQYKIVFEMYVLQGLKHKEIAQKLLITESSSRSYLTRAKNHIKKTLVEHGILPQNIADSGNFPLINISI